MATGLERIGRIVTAAAALLAITFFSLVSSHVSFIQMFGVGTGLAILLDATLVRGALVPAIMRVLGEGNWWAPHWLRPVYQRFGLNESAAGAQGGPDSGSPLPRLPEGVDAALKWS